MAQPLVLREVTHGNEVAVGSLTATFIEEQTGRGWILWTMLPDMRHSPYVVCRQVFTLQDVDFFQDIVDGQCACNNGRCVLVRAAA